MRAVNSPGAESDNSNVASKWVSGVTAARTVSVTVSAPPSTGRLVTVATNAWDYYRRAEGVLVRRAVVGQIALGRPCNASFRVAASHYEVNRADVTLTSTPRSSRLVTKCELR